MYIHFEELSRKKQLLKAQLNITTDLCLKFEMKTPSGCGGTVRTRFGQK